MCALKDEIKVQMQENQVCTDSSDNLVDVISVLENPFSGWKRHGSKISTKNKGNFVAPHTFLINSYLVPAKSEQLQSHLKNVTGLSHKNWLSNNLCVFWVY